MDLDRGKLEQQALRGQQAKTCLSFFDDFERDMKDRLWRATQRNDRPAKEALAYIAMTVELFKSFLQSAVGDGLVAEKELKEAENNG
ncbi:hypothetical protein [Pyramidobacter piscolens]|uniref:hypothetical protein n=1 Tax=Pyramidobacter piscolens TaxID=638849 RepID=UPI002AAF8E3D|nr:hypothetical protein [Pyramidobacter piscolens]